MPISQFEVVFLKDPAIWIFQASGNGPVDDLKKTFSKHAFLEAGRIASGLDTFPRIFPNETLIVREAIFFMISSCLLIVQCGWMLRGAMQMVGILGALLMGRGSR